MIEANEMSLADYAEMVGRVADKLDSLTYAMELDRPAVVHLRGLHDSLPDTVAELRKAYVGITGNDPWAKSE